MLDKVKMLPQIMQPLLGTLVGQALLHFKGPFLTFAISISRLARQVIVNLKQYIRINECSFNIQGILQQFILFFQCFQLPKSIEVKGNIDMKLVNPLTTNAPHIETSQLICSANQLTGFCMRATLVLNGLMCFESSKLYDIKKWKSTRQGI